MLGVVTFMESNSQQAANAVTIPTVKSHSAAESPMFFIESHL